MKIAIINDQHFGVRNDSLIFLSAMEKFYTETFFTTLDNEKIDTLLILGDIFDRRKYINFFTLYEAKRFFFNELKKRNIKVHMLVGNHDIYYKNTNRVNSPELTLGEYDNITIYTEPTIIDLGGVKVSMVPWINAENYKDAIAFIEAAETDIMFGHFELNGFEMHRGGGQCHDGMDISVFKKYKWVFSGHFHQPSTNGRGIIYLGAPAQFTWSDYGCKRGFNIMDLATDNITYVENPDKMFIKIFYDEDFDILEYDYTQLTNRIVRVLVSEKENQKKFDLFIDKLQQSNPYQLDVVDNSQYHFVEEGVDEDAIKSEDTISIVNSYIDGLDLALDNETLKEQFRKLYVEALAEDG